MRNFKTTILMAAVIAMAATTTWGATILLTQADVGGPTLTGNDYLLTQNVTWTSGNAFVFGNNATFDGQGFSVSYTGPSGSSGKGFDTFGSNYTLKNVTINDAPDQGVWGVNVSNILIENVTANNCGENGIALLGGDNQEVSNCSIIGCGFDATNSFFQVGVLFGGGGPQSNIDIHDCTITANFQMGLQVNTVSGSNFITDNEISLIHNIGMRLEGTLDNLLVDGNNIHDNNSEGIRVRGSIANMSISNNTIFNNTNEGIDVNCPETVPSDVTGNVVANNADPEIFAKNVDVIGNAVKGRVFIQADSGQTVNVKRNCIDGEGVSQVMDIGPAGGATFIVENNTINNYSNDAIRIHTAGTAQFNYNLITGITLQFNRGTFAFPAATSSLFANVFWNPTGTGGGCAGGANAVSPSGGAPICPNASDDPQYQSLDVFNPLFLAPGCGAANPLIRNGSRGAHGDSDGDGTADCDDTEVCDGLDNDGDGQIDEGFDADNDGVADCYDNCPGTFNPDQTDTDNDGAGDACDGCPNDPLKTSPGICGCGVVETGDTDLDGTPDCLDGCPNDPNKVAPGDCGCGIADTDTDNDGTPDCNDLCPNDPNKIAPGDCGCGIADTDTDNDGTPDCNDLCPNDPNKIAPGDCGCGIADTDTDSDGVPDCDDNCPNTFNPGQEDCDNDGIGDVCEAVTEAQKCAAVELAVIDCVCNSGAALTNIRDFCDLLIQCLDAEIAAADLCDPASCRATVLANINTLLGSNCQ